MTAISATENRKTDIKTTTNTNRLEAVTERVNRSRLLRAVELFDRVADALEQSIEALGAGDMLPAGSDVQKQIELTHKTLNSVFDIQERLAKRADTVLDAANAAAGVLDLDAARSEIRRRLDRLAASLRP